MLLDGSVHAADVRLGVGLAAAAVFVAVVGARGRRGRVIPAGSILALVAIVLGWLFGATLVWGTGGASKFRWSAAWMNAPTSWEANGLLVLALAGVLSLALSLRALTDGRVRAACMLVAGAGTTFAMWSIAVSYPVWIAASAWAAGAVAFYVAATDQHRERSERRRAPRRAAVVVPSLALACACGFGWTYWALAWTVVGREGQSLCSCWADQWGAWQYNAQFFIALGGAISLVIAVFWYATKRRRILMLNGVITLAAMATWSAFALTGSI